MLLGSRIKVGSTTRLKSAPGLSCEIICESTIPTSCQHLPSPIIMRAVTHHCPDQVQRLWFRLPGHPTLTRQRTTDCLLVVIYQPSFSKCPLLYPHSAPLEVYCRQRSKRVDKLAPEILWCECPKLTMLAAFPSCPVTRNWLSFKECGVEVDVILVVLVRL